MDKYIGMSLCINELELLELNYMFFNVSALVNWATEYILHPVGVSARVNRKWDSRNVCMWVELWF